VSLKIREISDVVGAEICNLDITRSLNTMQIPALCDAFLEYHLLCLHCKPLEPHQFVDVARNFGTPQLQFPPSSRHPTVPEVVILDSTFKRPEDKPADLRYVRLSGWHTDDSYLEIPAKATMLQALAVPDRGGETRFCNTRMAYDDLSAEMKHRLALLHAVHRYDAKRARVPPPNLSDQEQAQAPGVTHPLIRTHDETGCKAIYFNPNRTDAIVGMTRADSDKLLDRLYEHMTQSKYRYDHVWRKGDILLWDNRCLVHSINADFPVGQKRLHQRVLLKGARPF